MNCEVEIVTAEDLGPPSAPPAARNTGRPRGAKGKLRAELLAGFQEFLDAHPDANPLLVLAEISIDPLVKIEHRVSAAGRLANILVPRDMRFTSEINVDLRSAAVMSKMAALPGARGMIERMARAQASAVLASNGMSVDSHILPPQAGSQAALEAAPLQEGGEA